MNMSIQNHFAASGSCEVLTDLASLEFYGGDIMGQLAAPNAVVRPLTQDAAIQVVEFCLKSNLRICPRGGGASYTHAHVPAADNSIVLDMQSLHRIVDIDQDNMTVTVEPGVTWNSLNEALKPMGLRTPFWGPFSGLKATIGGSLSQHAISLGSGHYDASNSIVTGLKVVTGSGDIIDTGTTPSRFYRTYGPDLTGLFLGDSGAFGLKLEITLRLIKRPEALEAICVAYETFDDMADAMMAVSKLNVASEIIAIDPGLQKGQLGSVDKKTVMATVASVVTNASGPISSARSLLSSAIGTRKIKRRPMFVVMIMTEGHSRAEARAKLYTARSIATKRGFEIGSALAMAMRGDPFKPFTPLLSAQGERWLPLHAVIPYGSVHAFHKDLEAYYAEIGKRMQSHGARIATMYLTVGQNGFVYEPTLYWRDSQHAVHKGLMPENVRKALPSHPPDELARSFAFSVKKDIVTIMQKHGGAHYQLGKSYPFMSTREPGAKALLGSLKGQFDPNNIMNPGALEFPAD